MKNWDGKAIIMLDQVKEIFGEPNNENEFCVKFVSKSRFGITFCIQIFFFGLAILEKHSYIRGGMIPQTMYSTIRVDEIKEMCRIYKEFEKDLYNVISI